jgi:flagellar hook-length control protein FliK
VGEAQAADPSAGVQAPQRQEASGAGQSAQAETGGEKVPRSPEPVKRPQEERQAALEAAVTVRTVQGEPRAEETIGAAREVSRSTPEPDAGAQLARASLGALVRNEREFRLKLRPEGVGEVAVTIGARERDLHLTIRAAQESTKELILGQIGALKEQLEGSGYHLGGFSVDVSGGSPDGQGGQAFAFQQDPGRQPERQPEARRDVQPEAAPLPKEAQRAAPPKARLGAINYRI